MDAAQDGSAGQSTSNPIKESESEKIFVFPKVVHTASSIPVTEGPVVPMDITAAKSLGKSRHEVTNLSNFGRNDSTSSYGEFEFSPAYEHRSIGGGNQSSQAHQLSTSGLEQDLRVAKTSGGAESHAN